MLESYDDAPDLPGISRHWFRSPLKAGSIKILNTIGPLPGDRRFNMVSSGLIRLIMASLR